MLFSDAKGRKVVSTSSAETIAKVGGFVVDPKSRSVVAVEVKKTKDGDVVLWEDVKGFGEDAVTVESDEKITEAVGDVAVLADKHHSVLGKRVLSTAGAELGSVKDVEFDEATGTITGIVLDSETAPGNRLIGVGSWAVVIDWSN